MAERTHIGSIRLAARGLDQGNAKAHGQALAKALQAEFRKGAPSGTISQVTVRVTEQDARDLVRLAKRIRAAVGGA